MQTRHQMFIYEDRWGYHRSVRVTDHESFYWWTSIDLISCRISFLQQRTKWCVMPKFPTKHLTWKSPVSHQWRRFSSMRPSCSRWCNFAWLVIFSSVLPSTSELRGENKKPTIFSQWSITEKKSKNLLTVMVGDCFLPFLYFQSSNSSPNHQCDYLRADRQYQNLRIIPLHLRFIENDKVHVRFVLKKIVN